MRADQLLAVNVLASVAAGALDFLTPQAMPSRAMAEACQTAVDNLRGAIEAVDATIGIEKETREQLAMDLESRESLLWKGKP